VHRWLVATRRERRMRPVRGLKAVPARCSPSPADPSAGKSAVTSLMFTFCTDISIP